MTLRNMKIKLVKKSIKVKAFNDSPPSWFLWTSVLNIFMTTFRGQIFLVLIQFDWFRFYKLKIYRRPPAEIISIHPPRRSNSIFDTNSCVNQIPFSTLSSAVILYNTRRKPTDSQTVQPPKRHRLNLSRSLRFLKGSGYPGFSTQIRRSTFCNVPLSTRALLRTYILTLWARAIRPLRIIVAVYYTWPTKFTNLEAIRIVDVIKKIT